MNSNRLTRAVRILLTLAFVAAGSAKLAGVPQMVRFFDQIGFGQGFRIFTGVVEVVGGIALLVGPSALLAALALAFTMTAAVGVHLLKIGGNPLPALVLLLLCAFVAWSLHRASQRAVAPEG
jgi:uncharacterized membrane protein YphA (DoxX/SURF4 family)